MVTMEDVRKNEQIQALIAESGRVLEEMNYTEHGMRHAGYVSKTTAMILQKLGYDKRTVELGAIAGFVHDVGNAVNRSNHGVTSGLLIYGILKEMGMPIGEVCDVCAAVGNHEEEIGYVVSPISAALVIADKSDAHRTRVRRIDKSDLHDLVNFSILKNIVLVDKEQMVISIKFYMDETSSVMDYLSLFLSRMMMSEKAARYLGCTFKLYINDVVINTPKKM